MSTTQRGPYARDDIETLLEDLSHELVGAVEVADEDDRLDIRERLDEVEVLLKVRLGRGRQVLELPEEELEEVLAKYATISSGLDSKPGCDQP